MAWGVLWFLIVVCLCGFVRGGSFVFGFVVLAIGSGCLRIFGFGDFLFLGLCLLVSCLFVVWCRIRILCGFSGVCG